MNLSIQTSEPTRPTFRSSYSIECVEAGNGPSLRGWLEVETWMGSPGTASRAITDEEVILPIIRDLGRRPNLRGKERPASANASPSSSTGMLTPRGQTAMPAHAISAVDLRALGHSVGMVIWSALLESARRGA